MQIFKRHLEPNAEDATDRPQKQRPDGNMSAMIVTTALWIVLLGWAGWAVLAAEKATQDRNRTSLRALLSVNITAMEMWLSDRQRDAERHVAAPGFVEQAKEVLQSTTDDKSAPQADTSEPQADKSARVVAAMPALVSDIDRSCYIGWALLDMDRRVRASSNRSFVGLTFEIPADSLDKINARSSTVCRPFRSPVADTGESQNASNRAPLMAAIAPISSGGRSQGFLALLMDPRDRFSELFVASRSGTSGETYALDRNGVLLSESRFDTELRNVGLLSADDTVSSLLNVSIRDPGFELTSSDRADHVSSDWPLTLMADQATRGAKGENVTGYRNYRGIPVIGAWQWLPEYRIGVTTEWALAEASHSVRLLRWTCAGLLALITTTILAFWWIEIRGPKAAGGIPMVDRTDRRLGQYDLGELIGRGGMGSVYRGTHDVLKREVAVKVLEGEDVNVQSVTRFEREVRLTAGLRHPNTIAIYDYGRTVDDTFFYVMEYIDGITIQDLVDDFGRQPPQRVIYILLQICGSLAEAHEQGLVHRDIKPANILLTARAGLYDMIKVLDFGLVKEIERETMELTQSDAITGTPMYMSPESVRDATTADERSDLYSIGAVGYTLLTGLPTFVGEATVDICLKQLNEDPIRPSERIGVPLPEDLQNILMSCLRKDPDERPRTVQDFADGLRECGDAFGWSAADAYRWWQESFSQEVDSSDNDTEDGRDLDEQRIDTSTQTRK